MKKLTLVILLVFVTGCCQFGTWCKQLPEMTTFEECVAAGNPVMESYPRQCRHGDRTFTEELVGDDVDEYGCKPSTGYQWCESAKECIRYWETDCFCGGIAGFSCAQPWICELEGDFPDAGGVCAGEGARGLGVGESN